MNAWQRITIRYLLIWLAGTLVVVFVVIPSVRVRKVQNELNAADRLLMLGHPVPALARLERVELWAALYPALAQRLSCSAIRCHARLYDLASAKRRARDFEERYGTGRRPSKTMWESLQALSDALINASLPSPAEVHGEFGYEVLISELKQIGDLEQMDRLAKEMLKKDAGNELATKVREFVARKRAEAAKASAPPPPPPPSTPAHIETAKTEPVAEEVDHAELARKYIASKMWDQALQECDTALADNPQDGRAVALKRVAQARGMKWGCLRTTAKGYDASGTFIRDLPPFTVVDVSGTKSSPTVGELAVCKVTGEDGSISELLVPLKTMDLRTGPLSSAKEESKALWMQRTKLLAEIDQLKADQLKNGMKNNPFKPEYDAAFAAYSAYWAKEKQLVSQHQKATGEARIKLADDLKEMKLKGDDARLGRAYEEAKKKMNEWQDKNAAKAPEADPKVKALEEQLATLQAQIIAMDIGQ